MFIKVLFVLFLFKCGVGQVYGASCGDKNRCTCLNSVMDCRSQTISQFPTDIEKDIRALYLNDNRITYINQIPEEADLQTLVLTNNKIKSLSYNSFDNLDNLRTLILSNNSISVIVDDIFEWNPLKLEVLHLDGNKIEIIQHFLFYDLEELNELHLQNNKITYIHPGAFLQLKNLRNLRLDGNMLHSFNHKWIEKLQPNNLQELRFDDNDWSCDCAMRTSLTWLKREQLSHWFVDLTIKHPIRCALPAEFKNRLLVDLTEEQLASKCDMPIITGISSPATIPAGSNVLLRCVYDNTRSPVPSISWTAPNKDVYRLNNGQNYDGITVHQDGSLLITNLSVTDTGQYSCTAANVKGQTVANTEITVISPLHPSPPTTMMVVPSVNLTTEVTAPPTTITVAKECPVSCSCLSRQIDCSGGYPIVKDVPSNIPKDAISISLQSNALTMLGEKNFSDFNDLEELRLDENNIFTIDARAFEGLSRLKTLTLRQNKLTQIKNGTFSSLKNLQVLLLDQNMLTKLDDNTFKGLNALQWLYVRKNNIKTISSSAFATLKRIQYIHMESNEIRAIFPDTIKELTTTAAPSIKKIFLNDNAFECNDTMEEMRLFVRDRSNLAHFPNLFGDGIKCSFPPRYCKTYLHNIEKALTMTEVIAGRFVDGTFKKMDVRRDGSTSLTSSIDAQLEVMTEEPH